MSIEQVLWRSRLSQHLGLPRIKFPALCFQSNSLLTFTMGGSGCKPTRLDPCHLQGDPHAVTGFQFLSHGCQEVNQWMEAKPRRKIPKFKKKITCFSVCFQDSSDQIKTLSIAYMGLISGSIRLYRHFPRTSMSQEPKQKSPPTENKKLA